MNCQTCGKKLTDRTATKTSPYVYELSGLKDVRLIGITIHECTKCGFTLADIPRVDELHRVLSQWLLQKPGILEGAEIRFLRKDVELPANKLAEKLDITPEHLSRIETGKKDVSHQIDKLTRVWIAMCRNNTDIRDIIAGRKKAQLISFSASREKWELQEAA